VITDDSKVDAWREKMRRDRELHDQAQALFGSLIGATIADVRPVPASLREEYGWDADTPSVMLLLDDGRAVLAASNPDLGEPAMIVVDDRRAHRTHGADAPDDVIPEEGTFSLDLLVQLLEDRGITAWTDMTGGGTATVMMKPTFADHEDTTRYACLAGPGGFDGPAYTLGYASLADFAFGADDDGVSEPGRATGPISYRQLADQIAAKHRELVEMIPNPDSIERVRESGAGQTPHG